MLGQVNVAFARGEEVIPEVEETRGRGATKVSVMGNSTTFRNTLKAFVYITDLTSALSCCDLRPCLHMRP